MRCCPTATTRRVFRRVKKSSRLSYVLACLVFTAVFVNLSLFRSVLDYSAGQDTSSYLWGQPSLRDAYRLFEGIHDRSWVSDIRSHLHHNISRDGLPAQVNSMLDRHPHIITPSSKVEVVKMLEATAMERLACIQKRSQEMKEMVRLRAAAEQSSQKQASIDSNESVQADGSDSSLCVRHEKAPSDGERRLGGYVEGARPGLRPSYPERNFQRFCTDNVRLKHPSDFVTIGHIKPNIHLAIGVPTVSRPQESYLVNTLHNLFSKSTKEEMEDVAIIVFLADLGADAQKQQVKEQILKAFPNEVVNGDLLVVEAPADFYPPLVNLKRNFNDDPSRVYWRAKQCIDFSFIFSFAHNISRYYLHLEDDVITTNGYITSIKNSAENLKDEFMEMEFSVLGFIAKLFRSADLLDMAAFHFFYHEEMPVDFLQPLYLKLASPKYPIAVPHYPSLFQHKGKSSSLKGKKQTMQDPFFESYRMFMFKKAMGFNAFSSIHFTATNRPEMSLSAAGMYWSKATPRPKDHFTIWSDRKVLAEYMVIVSGNPKHPNDTAIGAKVEVSRDIVERNRKSVTCREPFTKLGRFDHAVFAVNMTSIGQFQCIRIMFTEERHNWLLISEVVFAEPNEYMMMRTLDQSRFVHLPSFLRTRYELYTKSGYKYI